MRSENSLLFLGDVAAYHAYGFSSKCKTVINIECPVTVSGEPSTGKIILRAEKNYLGGIFGSNLFAANLGNNHILDYGPEGLDSTINELEATGTGYFGLENLPGNNPLLVTLNDLKIAFISAVCESTSPVIRHNGVNYLLPLDTELISQKIKQVRDKAERIVVYIHWGVEESSLPSERDIRIARKLIDEGADIIIGSHAHAPQPFEKYRDGIIAYNLGNFIMPRMNNAPSYFDDSGKACSAFTRSLMIWNRISWGLEVDMKTMDFTIRRYIFTKNRVAELPFTPLDRYMKLPAHTEGDAYLLKIENHLRRRKMIRKIADFIKSPHVPQILKRKS